MDIIITYMGIGVAAVWWPGPDMALVLRTAINVGIKAAFAVVAGIIAGNGLMITAVLWGFDRLPKSVWLEKGIGTAGGAYLLYLAFRLFYGDHGVPGPGEKGVRPGWRTGLVTNILNPKAYLFFAAVLAPVVHEANGAVHGLGLMGGVILGFSGMVFAGRLLGSRIDPGRIAPVLDRGVAVILAGFGVSLFWSVWQG